MANTICNIASHWSVCRINWEDNIEDFYENNVFGQLISGRWENRICSWSVDPPPPGTISGVGAPSGRGSFWITGEKLILENPVTGISNYRYKVTFEVSPIGICNQGMDTEELKFEIELKGDQGDYTLVNPETDEPGIEIRCDKAPYSATGDAGVIVTFNSQEDVYDFNKACIHFENPGTILRGIRDKYLDNDRYCHSIKEIQVEISVHEAPPGITDVDPNDIGEVRPPRLGRRSGEEQEIS